MKKFLKKLLKDLWQEFKEDIRHELFEIIDLVFNKKSQDDEHI